MDDELLILHEGRPGRPEGRLEKSLRAALDGRAVRMVREGEALENRRVLFAFSLPGNGVNTGLWEAWSSPGPGTFTPRPPGGT